MICTGCGAETNAACNCGKAYVPKLERAAEYAEQHPTASVREIAERTGVGHGTAQEAKAGVRDRTPEPVTTGRDGKSYTATKPPTEPKPLDEGDLIVRLHNGPITEIRHGLQQLSPAARARLREMALDAWNDKRLDKPDEIAF
jgi:hypothetical protein